MSKLSFDEIRRRLDRENEFLTALGKDWLTKDEQKKRNKYVGGTITNNMRSRLEVHEILTHKPAEFTAYVDVNRKQVTTYIGDKIGDIKGFTHPYRSQQGDVRTNILVDIEGTRYDGIYYISNGNYAKLKKYKKEN